MIPLAPWQQQEGIPGRSWWCFRKEPVALERALASGFCLRWEDWRRSPRHVVPCGVHVPWAVLWRHFGLDLELPSWKLVSPALWVACQHVLALEAWQTGGQLVRLPKRLGEVYALRKSLIGQLERILLLGGVWEIGRPWPCQVVVLESADQIREAIATYRAPVLVASLQGFRSQTFDRLGRRVLVPCGCWAHVMLWTDWDGVIDGAYRWNNWGLQYWGPPSNEHELPGGAWNLRKDIVAELEAGKSFVYALMLTRASS